MPLPPSHAVRYGVSHVPDVMTVDLREVYAALQAAPFTPGAAASAAVSDASVSGAAATTDSSGAGEGKGGAGGITLLLCTDGVWDNWAFEDVASFMHKRTPHIITSALAGARAAIATDSNATASGAAAAATAAAGSGTSLFGLDKQQASGSCHDGALRVARGTAL